MLGQQYERTTRRQLVTQRLTPVTVSGIASGATAVAAGNAHTCAVVSGGVKCWGLNANGQLGDGTQNQSLIPVSRGRPDQRRSRVSWPGMSHTCARTTGSGAQCWGLNQEGELGDGTLVTPRLTAVAVTGMATGVSAITAGSQHTCALVTGGAVSCWGSDHLGQFGDNGNGQRLTPHATAGQPAVKGVAGGGLHTCAIVGNGGVQCWGANDNGQLGDGSIMQRLTPVDVVGLGSGTAAVATGATHTCALTAAGGAKCGAETRTGSSATARPLSDRHRST